MEIGYLEGMQVLIADIEITNCTSPAVKKTTEFGFKRFYVILWLTAERSL